jgi:hypothetical protein
MDPYIHPKHAHCHQERACYDMEISHDISFFCANGDSRSLKHVYKDYQEE